MSDVSPASADRVRYQRELEAVVGVLKRRFQNLTTDEVLKIAGDILIALDETIDL